MTLATRSKALLRALIYPVQFEADPRNAIDRVMERVVEPGCLDGTPAEYARSIRQGLATTERLAELVPQKHDEASIRGYLDELVRRIERDLRRSPDG